MSKVGLDFKIHEIAAPYGWVTLKAQPPHVSASAPGESYGRSNWIRSSVWMPKLLRSQTQSIAADLGMSWCEWQRLVFENQVNMAILSIVPRKDKPRYVE